MTGIGLDPSLSGLAICCIRTDGTIRETLLPKSEANGDTVGGRIARYRQHTNAVIAWLKANAEPGPLLIEGYSFNSQNSRAHQAGEFGMYLRLALLKNGYVPVESPPAILKRFATGSGNANKTLVASALARRYDREFPDGDDQADAFGLAKLCACMLGIEEPQTDFQRKATEDMRKNLDAERANPPW